mmetsp:Transcript_126279/g.252288  ORF Transcript_126279/g.252288 Transcript_126279/m.252288 type:complete len:233 (-) Transcript_126279:301-999(-)
MLWPVGGAGVLPSMVTTQVGQIAAGVAVRVPLAALAWWPSATTRAKQLQQVWAMQPVPLQDAGLLQPRGSRGQCWAGAHWGRRRSLLALPMLSNLPQRLRRQRIRAPSARGSVSTRGWIRVTRRRVQHVRRRTVMTSVFSARPSQSACQRLPLSRRCCDWCPNFDDVSSQCPRRSWFRSLLLRHASDFTMVNSSTSYYQRFAPGSAGVLPHSPPARWWSARWDCRNLMHTMQ